MSSPATETNTEQVLAASRLALDPRIEQAKKLILEAVAEHQSSLAEIRGADESLAAEYQQVLDSFGKLRGGNLYFPYLASGIGNGPFVELADGSVKLDLITGIGVHGFGHSDPRLIEAGIEAALCDTVMQGNLQQGVNSVDLVSLLCETANESGAGIDHCFLSTSGAMANENALKIAFQKNFPANRVLAFDHCFAGRTLCLAQITDKAAYRVGLPDTIAVDKLPFFDHKDPEGSTQRAVEALQQHTSRYPGQHALLWMELIQGEGGYYLGHRDFFVALIDEAKKHNIAIIADEVQTFCRTSRPFAFQHFELDQLVDIITIGKISQVCATLFRDDYNPKPGLISQTFTGSTWAILAAQKIVKSLIDDGNFGPDGKNMMLFNHFESGLKAISQKYPSALTGPHGIGGMVAFTPGNGSADAAKAFVGKMYDAGLMSFMAGANPARVRFLMPLGCVTTDHIDIALKIIESVAAEMAS